MEFGNVKTVPQSHTVGVSHATKLGVFEVRGDYCPNHGLSFYFKTSVYVPIQIVRVLYVGYYVHLNERENPGNSSVAALEI